MRVWGELMAAGFRRWSTYRLATAAGAFTNTVFGLLIVSVYAATARQAGGTVAGYDATQAATYAWVAQALIAPVHVFAWNELALRVRTGDVAVDLARPVDVQLSYLALDVGRAGFQTVPRSVPPLLVGAVTGTLVMPAAVAPYALGLVSVVAAVLVSFGLRYLVNLSAFWLLEIRGPLMLYLVASNGLSGMIVPVRWFPDWLQTLARATPFPSLIQVPADVLTGRLAGSEAVRAIGGQLAWVVVVMLLGRAVMGLATRRVVVQGG